MVISKILLNPRIISRTLTGRNYSSISSSTIDHDPDLKKSSRILDLNAAYQPELVLFSDTLITPLRFPMGVILAEICKNHHTIINSQLLQTSYDRAFEIHSQSVPLYTPGESMDLTKYKSWYKELFGKALMPFRKHHHTGISDDKIFDQVKYKAYQVLLNSKSYYVPSDFFLLLKRLRLQNVPYGIIANQSPVYNQILSQLNEKFPKDPVFTVPGENIQIPVFNAAESGFAKPNPAVFTSALSHFKPSHLDDVYYVGNSVDLDFNPTKKLGIRAILHTKNLNPPISDIKFLNHKKCRTLPAMRIARVDELNKVFFKNESMIPGIKTKRQKKMTK